MKKRVIIKNKKNFGGQYYPLFEGEGVEKGYFT